jgi:hypothetical protein
MYLGEMHAYGTHKSLKSFAHILYINHGTTFSVLVSKQKWILGEREFV